MMGKLRKKSIPFQVMLVQGIIWGIAIAMMFAGWSIFAIGTLGVGAVVTVFLLCRTLAPMKDLILMAEAIRAGELGVRVGEQSSGEIEALVTAMNDMAASLSDYVASIRHQAQVHLTDLECHKDALKNQEQECHHKTAELEQTRAVAETAQRRWTETNQRLEELVQHGNAVAAAAETAGFQKIEFLAVMAYQIRTQLTCILGFAESLSDPVMEPAERADALATIRRNGERVLGFIDDILDITHLEIGRLEVNHAICSPFQVVAETESTMRQRALEKGLNFVVDYIGDIPETIQTDQLRLRQILQTLVAYAVDNTSEGGVRLVVQFSEDTIEPLVQFEVIDTGAGLTSDGSGGLFDLFASTDVTPGGEAETLRLRLGICQRLAKLLGGDLEVESTPDQGTIFRLTIAAGPLDGVELVDGAGNAIIIKEKRGICRPTEFERQHLDARILLVEDGLDNQRLVTQMLRKAGGETETAENGREGVDLAMSALEQARPFDIILMDMQMPVMDGYEATRELRRRSYDGLIVALTAHAMAGDRERCLAAGCDDYFTKPIDRLKLLTLLHERLEERRSAVFAAGV